MSFQGFVDGKDIDRLGPDDFRTVMNRIAEVEALRNRIALSKIDLSTRNNDADEGLDGRVHWPADVVSDIFVSGENALQYKAGKLKPNTLKKETRKRGVRDILARGGGYVMCVGHDYNPTAAQKWRRDLRKLATNRKLDPNRFKIMFGSEIGRIASQFPSVIVLPELRKDIPLIVTVANWSEQHKLNWTPDGPRLEIIERIRSFLQDARLGNVLRIEGPAGVGKTRVVLEAVREHGIAESTVYVHNSEDDHLQDLLGFLVGNPRSYAVVVADECSAARQDTLRSYVEACAGRVKLVCVGTPDLLSPRLSASANLIFLPTLSDDRIRQILSQVGQPVPPEIVETAVRVSKGFVKLSIFVVRQLLQQKDLNLLELSKIGDVGDFLRRFVKPNIRGVLQALSLLGRVGWKDDLVAEAECIAKFLGIQMREMRDGVVALRSQGVLMDQGRYCYVSPDLLAIFSAAQLWDQQGPELIRILDKLPGREPCFQLLRRLAAMGEHPDVKNAVEKMLQPDGVYRSLGDLDDEFRSEMLRILASALPDAVTDVIKRIITNSGHVELLDFSSGRRNVLWTLESLLRWPTTSLEAAQTLKELALAENESIGNNATGIFCQYFQVYLSGTPVEYRERLPLLDDLISDGTEESFQLAVKAASAGLAHYESRMGGNVDDISGRPYPPEWRPAEWEDLWSIRRELIDRLAKLAQGSDTSAASARAALIGSVFTLIRDGIWADAITLLESLRPEKDSERRAILDAVKRLEKEVGTRLSEPERQRLSNIQSMCFDDTFSGRLRRWVGKRLHADFDVKGVTGFDVADQEVRNLADFGYEHGISPTDLKWLCSVEAENAWQFGTRLGELDLQSAYWPKIVDASNRDVNALFLGSYAVGQGVARGQMFRESILDDLEKAEPVLAFAATWRGASSEQGLKRVLRLVDEGVIAPEMLGYLAFGGWTHAFSATEVRHLLERLLKGVTAKVLDPAFGIALHLLNRDAEAFVQIEPLLWQMVEVKPETGWSWEWELIAQRLVKHDPNRITSIVLKYFADEHYLAHTGSPEQKVLFQAAEISPKESWNLVGPMLSRMDSASHRLLLALGEAYGEMIPTDVLVQWAREHLPYGPGVVAKLVAIKSKKLPERARTLLRVFKGNKYVQSTIAAHLSSGSWMGPFSGRLKYELDIAEGWVTDPEPSVRQFAKTLVKGLKQRLNRQEMLEEEGHI